MAAEDIPADPDPGRIGRYEILRKLGAGAMGVVYAAHDPELQRELAVKLLRRECFRSTELELAGERLRREAQVAARLAHPNVVTIYDVGSHEGSVYVAMERVDGPSLQRWLGETRRPWREVMAMFFHAGRGLAAAHGVGLIHRDFKPANVLVGTDHRPRVVDFGLAHFGAVPGQAVHAVPGPDVASTTAPAGGGEGGPSRLREVDTRETLPDVAMPSEASGTRPPREDDVLGTVPGDTATGLRTRDVLGSTRGAGETFGSGVRARDVLGTDAGMGGSVAPDHGSGGRARFDALSTASSVSSMAGTTLGHELRATVGDDPTATGLFVGTPAYMAPELFTGAGADARTDQFAFCVALYEGLYGERPFAGETAMEIAGNVVAGHVRPAPSRTRVPGWLRAIIVRGLARSPDDRHESVKSLLASIAFTSRVMWGE
jgi:serine/threonine protein kinase